MPTRYRPACLHPNNPYKLEVDGTVITNHGVSNYTHYTDGFVLTEVKVWSRNSQNVSSATPGTKNITTPAGLRKSIEA